MEDQDNSKALIPVDQIMEKDDLEGISIAEFAAERLDPDYVESLPARDRSVVAGAQFLEGGVFRESIRVAGNFSSDRGIICENISVAGNCKIDDFLVVKGNTRFAGSSLIRGHLITFASTSIGGKSNVNGSIINSGTFKIGGTLRTEQIVSDGNFTIGGKLYADRIKAISDIKVSGQLYIEEDIKAQLFHMRSGRGIIKGNLFAEDVIIGNPKALNFPSSSTVTTELGSPIGVFTYIKDILAKYLIHRNFKSRKLFVSGDIVAKNIYLEDVTVEGNIRGEYVEIGPNVDIGGVLEYREKLTITESRENAYQIKNLSSSKEEQ
jgi:predicted acyltransferase (DUF342 family)